ncbi:MAG: hypothetical protein ACM3U2_16350 [Deltaproteobacteria bacterium]
MESLNELLTSPLGLAAAGVAAFVIGSLFFNVKQWEAHWKQWAIDTSKAMSKAGLVHTPKILDGLAVGDLAGAFREIKGLADVFKDPKQLAAEFATVFQNMLDSAFKDPAQAKALQQLANDAVAAFASGDPAQAAGQLAADAQSVLSASPLFGSIAKNGLALPTLQLLPHLAVNPALANIAGVLGSANLGHLFPLVAAGAQAMQSAGAPAAGLPAVPSGHVVTIAGPATATSAPPASPPAANPAAA